MTYICPQSTANQHAQKVISHCLSRMLTVIPGNTQYASLSLVVSRGAVRSAASSYAAVRMVAGSRPTSSKRENDM